MVRGNRFALFALILSQAMVLLRSAVIARALGPEQYGIAATFILLQQFLDSSSDTGLNKFVVAHAKGHQRTILATAHAITLARSLLIAALLMGVALPVFRALDLPGDVLPFAVLAASVLCIGLTHYDGFRMQRSGDLSNISLGNLLADVLATGAAVLLVLVDQSYMVAIYVILAKSLTATLMSFLLARRPYRIAFDRPSATTIWAYSLPLMVNGPILFFSAQSERLAAATLLPAEQLGIYTAALLLIYTPTQLFQRFLSTVFLPQMSREVRETGRHGPRFALLTFGSAVVMAAGYAVAGQWLILLIFGAAYRLDWQIVSIIGLTQAVRFSRSWCSGVALAYGVTGSIPAANSLRLVLLPLCMVGGWTLDGMRGLAIGALAGESIAMAHATWSVRRAIARRAASPPSERPASLPE